MEKTPCNIETFDVVVVLNLVHEHHMYIISSAYGYCGKDYSDSNKSNGMSKIDFEELFY